MDVGEPENTSYNYLKNELKIINLKLQNAVFKIQKQYKNMTTSGIFISDEEVSTILQSNIFEVDDEENYKLSKKIKEIRLTSKNNKQSKIALIEFVEKFSLNDLEKEIILLCVAPEIFLKYEKIFAYLHDDITKKLPTINLIASILASNEYEKIKIRQYFNETSKLFKYNILYFDSTYEQNSPVSSIPIRLNEKIINFILGNNDNTSNKNFQVDASVLERIFEKDIKRLEKIIENNDNYNEKQILSFTRKDENNKQLTYIACTFHNKKIQFISIPELIVHENPKKILEDRLLSSIINNQILYFEEFSLIFQNSDYANKIKTSIEKYQDMISEVIFVENDNNISQKGFWKTQILPVGIKTITHSDRLLVWNHLLKMNQ